MSFQLYLVETHLYRAYRHQNHPFIYYIKVYLGYHTQFCKSMLLEGILLPSPEFLQESIYLFTFVVESAKPGASQPVKATSPMEANNIDVIMFSNGEFFLNNGSIANPPPLCFKFFDTLQEYPKNQ